MHRCADPLLGRSILDILKCQLNAKHLSPLTLSCSQYLRIMGHANEYQRRPGTREIDLQLDWHRSTCNPFSVYVSFHLASPSFLTSLFLHDHQNTDPSYLSGPQLQLAFSSLVRSLSASSEDALAWSCIDALLTLLHSIRSPSAPPSSSAQYPSLSLYPPASNPELAEGEEHIERALIACISALNISLLPRFLNTLETDVLQHTDGRKYGTEIAEQVMARVGDAQKDVALGWWMRLRERGRGRGREATETEVRAVL